MTMRISMAKTSTRGRTAVRATATVLLGVLAVAGCGKNGQDPQPAAPATSLAPAASSPVPSSPAPTSPAPTSPATSPPAASASVPGGRPQVTLTDDPIAAGDQLARLRETGWFNPNKIEYADDAVIALQQFKRWLDQGYIARDGAWTPEGLAAVERANKNGTPL